MAINILGTELAPCSYDPMTGFTRNGCCETGPMDVGSHTVCAVMTEEFLAYTRDMGNDLSTPLPEYDFPGLKPGDRWCVCASRWEQAREANVAPPVVLESTHAKALEILSKDALIAHALEQEA